MMKLTVAAVSENRRDMLYEAYLLFRSLRKFSGRMSNARAVLYCVDSMPSDGSEFDELGVELRLVQTIHRKSPHCNKIHMLLDEYDTDWLIAMDVDTVFVGDVSPYLEKPLFAAKIVDANPFSEQLWGKLYHYFGMEMPRERFLTHFHARPSNPYFNSGVLFIPGEIRVSLGKVWLEMISRIMEIYSCEPEMAEYSFFTDQFALALALTKTRTNYQLLPLELNFPTHKSVHSRFVHDEFIPSILHHHHKINHLGQLEHCEYPSVNNVIDAFNQSLANDSQPLFP